QPVTIRIGYEYGLVYLEPLEFQAAFGRFSGTGTSISSNSDRSNVVIWNEQHGTLGGLDMRDVAGLGGWMLDVHHVYDPRSRTLYQGDGRHRSANSVLGETIASIAGKDDKNSGGDGGLAT